MAQRAVPRGWHGSLEGTVATTRATRCSDAGHYASEHASGARVAWSRIQLTTPVRMSHHPTRPLQLTATTTPSTRPTRKPKIKRNRKGSGPFKSVLRERSVHFNLTLDVQTLQQQIQQLTTTRDLLQSRVLQFRHSPTGSLMHVVREFFRLFREGLRVESPPAPQRRRRHVITHGVQRDFLSSVLDEDVNSALGRMGGVGFMVEQFRRYSLLLRTIWLQMDSFEIVLMDDRAVMVRTKGSLRFQVLRETVRSIFPHVLGDEWLCARLIGAEVEAPTVITFDFNATDRICGYEPDVDHVTGFSKLLHDPNDVLQLLGEARIGVKSTIGVADDGRLEALELVDEPQHEDRSYPHAPATRLERSSVEIASTDPERPRLHSRSVHNSRSGHEVASASRQPTSHLLRPTQSTGFVQTVVGHYMLAFVNGWPLELHRSTITPRQFLQQFVSPRVIVNQSIGHDAIERAWRALHDSFEIVGFRATGPPQLHNDGSTVSAHVRAVYDVVMDIRTLQTVFPHTLHYPSLVQALLGMNVTCPSDVWFEWSGDGSSDGMVTRLSERLDWDAALAPLLPDAQERSFVLAQARLTPEGYVA